MATTRKDYIGDGVRTVYDVSFDLGFVSQSHIYAYVEGNDYDNQMGYTWINSNQIMFTSAPASGQKFYIRRVVPRDAPFNKYEEGAILRERNLDASFVQALMILQEIADGYIVTGGEAIFETDIKINGDINVLNATVNEALTVIGKATVPEPEDGTDATTKNYVDREITNTVTYIDTEIAETVAYVDQTAEETREYASQLAWETQFQEAPANVIYAAVQLGDGVRTSFTSPTTTRDISANFLVTVDGIKQAPVEDFTIEQLGEVEFNEAPPVGARVLIGYFNANILKIEGTEGIIPHEVARAIGDGTTTTFPTGAGKYIPEVLFQVDVGGVRQRGVIDFVCGISGQVIFDTAPPTGVEVDIKWFQPNMPENVQTANAVLMMNKYITHDLVVADPYNAVSVSPEIVDDVEVTIAVGATYIVL